MDNISDELERSVLTVINELADCGLKVGVVWAEGVTVSESQAELVGRLQSLVKERQDQDFPPEKVRVAVRSLLRSGGYRPSGRGKPASEYLAQAAREQRFPYINNLVDVNNYISLLSGLPVSLLDLSATGTELRLRYGKAGECYTFNSAGQEIDLEGLISVCRAEPEPNQALGNPVKDSLIGKINTETAAVVGVIYCPGTLVEALDLAALTLLFSDLLQHYGNADSSGSGLW